MGTGDHDQHTVMGEDTNIDLCMVLTSIEGGGIVIKACVTRVMFYLI